MAEQEAHTLPFKENLMASEPWWKKIFQVLWKITAFLGAVVVVGLMVGVASAWLTSSNGVIPSNSPFGKLIAQWPITLLVGCCLLLMALLIGILSRWPTHKKPSSDEETSSPSQAVEQQTSSARPVPLLSDVDRQYRMRLLSRVIGSIKGELENSSLYTEAHIDTVLSFKEEPDSLENPLRHQYQELNSRH